MFAFSPLFDVCACARHDRTFRDGAGHGRAVPALLPAAHVPLLRLGALRGLGDVSEGAAR